MEDGAGNVLCVGILLRNIVSATLYDTAVFGILELCMQAERCIAETDWDYWENGRGNLPLAVSRCIRQRDNLLMIVLCIFNGLI